MVVVSCICVLSIFHILGKILAYHLKIKNVQHPIIYGSIGYILVSYSFIVLSMLFNTSFNVLFYGYVTVCVGSIVLIFNEVYRLRKVIFSKITGKEMLGFFKKRWLLFMLIFLFYGLYLYSSSTFYIGEGYPLSMASWDTLPYVQRINQVLNMNSFHDILKTDVKNIFFLWESVSALNIHLLGISLPTYLFIIIPIFIYIFTFFLVDEVLYQLFEKNYKYISNAIAISLIMYLPLGFQYEVSKFMFSPYFGNVIVTMTFFPLLILLFKHSLSNIRVFYSFFPIILLYFGFSIGSFLYIGITLWLIVILWYYMHKYSFKYSKKVVFLGILISLSFLSFFILQWFLYFDFTLSNFDNPHPEATRLSEHPIYEMSFQSKLFLVSPAIVLFFVRYARQEINLAEKVIGICTFLFLLIGIYSRTSIALFNITQFTLHRFYESILFLLIIYLIVVVLGYLHTTKQRYQLLVITGIILFSISIRPTVFNTYNDFFKKENVMDRDRLPLVSSKLTQFMTKEYIRNDEKKLEIMYFNNLFFESNKSRLNRPLYIDVSSDLSDTRNIRVKRGIYSEDTTGDYFIVAEKDKENFEKNYQKVKKKIVKKIITKDITVFVYKNMEE